VNSGSGNRPLGDYPRVSLCDSVVCLFVCLFAQ